MPAPAIPQNLIVQQANGQVGLRWDTTAGATSYHVYRSTDNITFALLNTTTVPNFLDTTVVVSVPGTQYWYRITSDNGSESTPTDSQTAIPAASGNLSLYELRLMSKQRADRVNSDFVTDSEWDSYLNQSYYELYDILVTTYGDEYYRNNISFTTDGTAEFPLPDGINYSAAPPFYKALGVDLAVNPQQNAYFTIKRFEFIERNRYTYPQLSGNWLGIFNLRYRIFGDKIIFIPIPAANQTIRLWYIPRLTELLQNIDICFGISGWTEYLIVDAAIKALQKEETDVQVLLAQKQMLIKRIEESAQARDVGQPAVISDTRRWSGPWGYSGGPDEPMGGY